MDYKNNSNTGLTIVADCMLLSVEYIGNVHLFFNNRFIAVTAIHMLCAFLLKCLQFCNFPWGRSGTTDLSRRPKIFVKAAI